MEVICHVITVIVKDMMDLPLKMLLASLITATIATVCKGQREFFSLIPDKFSSVATESQRLSLLFRCQYNGTEKVFISWAVNGEPISNVTDVFSEAYQENYRVAGNEVYSLIMGVRIPTEHHLFNFTCRVYEGDSFVTDSNVNPLYETRAGTLIVFNRPLQSDPACMMGLTTGSEDSYKQIIEVKCCVHQTTESLNVSLLQNLVVWYQNATKKSRDVSESKQQCFTTVIAEETLNDGKFECKLDSEAFSVKQKCAFASLKPVINLSQLHHSITNLTCHLDKGDVIGYIWSVDKPVDFSLSDDRKHFITRQLEKKVTVRCTVFTLDGYGSIKLQIIPAYPPESPTNPTVILLSCILAVIIAVLMVVIIAYLIVMRGICFCFRPPDRYTERDLRRLQEERESRAHFQTITQNRHPGEVVRLVPNGHRYLVATDDGEVPPVPGGNAQFSSHLLDYADLDHGSTPSDDVEDAPAVPQRPETSKVEYADILKPPTTSLRDMS